MLNVCGSGGIQEQLRVSDEISFMMSVGATIIYRVDRAKDVLQGSLLLWLSKSVLVGGKRPRFFIMWTSPAETAGIPGVSGIRE